MSDSPVFVTAAEASPGIEHARAAGIGTPLLCEIIARNSFGGTIDVVAVAREAYDAGARIDMTESAVSAYRARDPMYYPEELEVWSPHMRLRKPRPWLTLLLAALTCAAVLALVFVRAYS